MVYAQAPTLLGVAAPTELTVQPILLGPRGGFYLATGGDGTGSVILARLLIVDHVPVTECGLGAAARAMKALAVTDAATLVAGQLAQLFDHLQALPTGFGWNDVGISLPGFLPAPGLTRQGATLQLVMYVPRSIYQARVGPSGGGLGAVRFDGGYTPPTYVRAVFTVAVDYAVAWSVSEQVGGDGWSPVAEGRATVDTR
jgi:hypothetical protein